MYYLLLPDLVRRTALITGLRERGIQATFHYVPLHSAPHGLAVGRAEGPMTHTNDLSDRLVRLPLWPGMEPLQAEVIDRVRELVTR